MGFILYVTTDKIELTRMRLVEQFIKVSMVTRLLCGAGRCQWAK